jgi:hypothetical protein
MVYPEKMGGSNAVLDLGRLQVRGFTWEFGTVMLQRATAGLLKPHALVQ